MVDAVFVQEPDVAEPGNDIGRMGLGHGEAPYADPRLRSQAHARGGHCGKRVDPLRSWHRCRACLRGDKWVR